MALRNKGLSTLLTMRLVSAHCKILQKYYNNDHLLTLLAYFPSINDEIKQIKFDENAKLLLGDKLTTSLSSGTRDDLRIRRMNIVESN